MAVGSIEGEGLDQDRVGKYGSGHDLRVLPAVAPKLRRDNSHVNVAVIGGRSPSIRTVYPDLIHGHVLLESVGEPSYGGLYFSS